MNCTSFWQSEFWRKKLAHTKFGSFENIDHKFGSFENIGHKFGSFENIGHKYGSFGNIDHKHKMQQEKLVSKDKAVQKGKNDPRNLRLRTNWTF